MLKTGFGRTDITPKLGTRLGGYGVEHRPAEEILDKLHSTAMVLEQDGTEVVILNLDWVMIGEETVASLREKINKKTGIIKEHINIAVSHSHSSPCTASCWGWGEADYEYIGSVSNAIVESVIIARDCLQEAEVGFAVTESLTGVSRRLISETNGFDYNADPHGSFDPEMTIVRFRNAGRDIGIIVHYGAHCTAMGANRLISRDWCGVMKDRIEGQFNVPILFLNGAIGGVGPRTNVLVGENNLAAGWGDGIESVREVGYRAATDAMRALLSIKEWRKGLELNVQVENISIPYAPLKPLEDAQLSLKKYEPVKTQFGWNMCEYEYNRAVIKAYQQKILSGREFTQTIVTLGPLAIVPFPGEVFPGITLRIKHGSPYQHTLCTSVTNGYWAYLFSREAIHRDYGQIFEVWFTRAINGYLFADNIDDVLVEQNLKILRGLNRKE